MTNSMTVPKIVFLILANSLSGIDKLITRHISISTPYMPQNLARSPSKTVSLPVPAKSNSLLTYMPSLSISVMANIIHDRGIMKNMYRCPSGFTRSSSLFSPAFSMAMHANRNSPHMTKFHPAPCHMPVSAHTTSRFR